MSIEEELKYIADKIHNLSDDLEVARNEAADAQAHLDYLIEHGAPEEEIERARENVEACNRRVEEIEQEIDTLNDRQNELIEEKNVLLEKAQKLGSTKRKLLDLYELYEHEYYDGVSEVEDLDSRLSELIDDIDTSYTMAQDNPTIDNIEAYFVQHAEATDTFSQIEISEKDVDRAENGMKKTELALRKVRSLLYKIAIRIGGNFAI